MKGIATHLGINSYINQNQKTVFKHTSVHDKSRWIYMDIHGYTWIYMDMANEKQVKSLNQKSDRNGCVT